MKWRIGEVMSISPKDLLNKNKNLNKRVEISEICLENVTIDDLKFDGNNYSEYINLYSLLDIYYLCHMEAPQ